MNRKLASIFLVVLIFDIINANTLGHWEILDNRIESEPQDRFQNGGVNVIGRIDIGAILQFNAQDDSFVTLDQKRYARKWYNVQRTDNAGSSDQTCITFTYNTTCTNGIMTITDRRVMSDGSVGGSTRKLVLEDMEDTKGTKYHYKGERGIHYYILSTDYENYSIEYELTPQYATKLFVYSSTPVMEEEYKNLTKKILARSALGTIPLVDIDMTNC